MTTSNVPAFSSPELQSAVNDARSAFEGADDARNRVSTDIKALEAYLLGLDLKTAFRYSLGKCLEPDDEQCVAASLEYGGSASGHIQEEFIAFDVDAKGKRRLLHEVYRWEGYVNVDMPGGPYFWDSKTEQMQSRPLIETKFEIRKRVHPRLADFVRSFAKELTVDPSGILGRF